MAIVKTGVKTGGARVWMLTTETATTAAITEITAAFKSPSFSGATPQTTDGTLLGDDVVNNLTTGIDEGTFSFVLVPDPGVVANEAAISKILANKGKSVRLFIGAKDGVQASPTLPVAVGGVASWTLPASPFAFTGYEFEAEMPASFTPQFEQSSLVSYAGEANKKSSTIVQHKGATASLVL